MSCKVGTGGKEAIDQSHFVGAVYGMENIMGRCKLGCSAGRKSLIEPVQPLFDELTASVCCGYPLSDDNPVRKLYNKAWADFASDIPICWMQTVCAKDEATNVYRLALLVVELDPLSSGKNHHC